jgi:hypothetical protein
MQAIYDKGIKYMFYNLVNTSQFISPVLLVQVYYTSSPPEEDIE